MSANANALIGANMTFDPAVVGAGSTASNYSIGAAFGYTVDGRFYSKATVANGTTPVVNSEGRPFREIKANQQCVFVFGIDAAGDVAIAQGEIIDALATTQDAAGRGQYPTLPKTHTPFGAVMVAAGSTAVGSWLMGANDFTGVTGVTATFEDLAMFPSEPM